MRALVCIGYTITVGIFVWVGTGNAWLGGAAALALVCIKTEI